MSDPFAADFDILEHFRELGRQVAKLNDGKLRGQQCIYILEFEGGVVKVGHTTDYYQRVRSHCYNALTRGKKLLREWHHRSERALDDERELIRLAYQIPSTRALSGREWFVTDASVLIDAADRWLESLPSEQH